MGLRFTGEPEDLTEQMVFEGLLEVRGGSVTGARKRSAWSSRGWDVTVTPDGPGEISIRLPVRACTEANAACIGGQPLEAEAAATVPGQAMTASFANAAEPHDGETSFELHLDFSHAPADGFSYVTVRDALLDVTGATLERVWRREAGKNRKWGLELTPSGEGDVTISVRRHHRLRGRACGLRQRRTKARRGRSDRARTEHQ